ncbi:MAG: cystathionine beta-lyase [Hydrogenophilaceae bacterium]|jgi:cystathionine beta-lyase|nr:cystathionine beta-lyase [Hydrogenophilaceae bacterium]
MAKDPRRIETRVAQAGRDHARSDGAVNPPVHHASTLIIDHVEDLYGEAKRTYALDGMSVHEALKEALIAVEGGAGATLAPSGLAACTLALLACVREGGEALVTDSVYKPTRRFCDRMLKRLGVRTRYYDPGIGAGIAELITDATCAVFLESPGSLTFEVQDVPAIAAAARARDAATIIDNTWSAGVYFKPFAHGIDLSIQALTKYQGGHSDLLVGAVLARSKDWQARVFAAAKELGLGVAPDDAYLALRGMRTMLARLSQQSASALKIAQWLETRAEVARVIHPALESHRDHALWRRDFSGASALFGFVLRPCAPEKLKAMLEGFSVLKMGFSWGGYESLIVPCSEQLVRTARPWREEGELIRLSVGLEHPDDLLADLEAGLARLA